MIYSSFFPLLFLLLFKLEYFVMWMDFFLKTTVAKATNSFLREACDTHVY